MIFKGDKPYEEYTVYKYLNTKENRYYCQLVNITDTHDRIWLSYARYLMSIKEGRILSKYEHVDHIDNNKLNDNINNLQILTPQQNNVKSAKQTWQHGTLAGYRYCKCMLCKQAKEMYMKYYNQTRQRFR